MRSIKLQKERENLLALFAGRFILCTICQSLCSSVFLLAHYLKSGLKCLFSEARDLSSSVLQVKGYLNGISTWMGSRLEWDLDSSTQMSLVVVTVSWCVEHPCLIYGRGRDSKIVKRMCGTFSGHETLNHFILSKYIYNIEKNPDCVNECFLKRK